MRQSGLIWRRRAMLAGGALAALAWVAGAPHLARLWPAPLRYRAIPGLAPFRALETSGGMTAASVMLQGLDDAIDDPGRAARIADIQANLCAALFGASDDARLPVAFFTDFNCPNCRALDAILQAYDAANPGTIRIVRHQLPLLGHASVLASRAVLAAGLQGDHGALESRLMRAQLVTDIDFLVSIAESIGLDASRLVADMQSQEVSATLTKSTDIADIFGFYGTPSTVAGRTVFMGALPAATVKQIISAENELSRQICAAT